MGAASSSKRKKQYFKIGSSKYKVISTEFHDDIVQILIVAECKTKEQYLLKKMLINSGSNTIDYLSGADILSRLPSHPNIVRYVGSSHFVLDDGYIEFAMLTENTSSWLDLSDLIRQKVLTEFKLKLKAFADVIHAISHCHQHNIAHLCIHPRNILQDGFGTFKLANFDSAVTMNQSLGTPNISSRNSVFGVDAQQNSAGDEQKTGKWDDSIFVAPELFDPQQYTAVFANKLSAKADIWSLGCLLLYLLYDGEFLPQWYTNKLGVKEADVSMFLGSYVSNFVKANMIHSNPHKRISILDVAQFIATATEYNDPVQFLSSLSPSLSPQLRTQLAPTTSSRQQRLSMEDMNLHLSSNKKRKRLNEKNSAMVNNPTDALVHKILKNNSQMCYNRLMVNFWDNSNDKDVICKMSERIFMCSSIICNRSSLTAIKIETLIHRLFLQTPQEFMKVATSEMKFFSQLIAFWKVDSSQDFMKDLVIAYAKFMISRLKFHSKNPIFESNFSLSLFMYNHHRKNYASFRCAQWFDEISQSLLDLIDFGRHHCSLINSILSHQGFTASIADVVIGNILNNCLIPLFEDLHSLYLITTWIVGLLRISFGKKQIASYADKYKDFMISLIAAVSRIQNTATIVWNCIDIDTQQFPKIVPKTSSILLSDIYPPSSFAPNLATFNRDLVNHFVNVIHQQLNPRANTGTGGHTSAHSDRVNHINHEMLPVSRAKSDAVTKMSAPTASAHTRSRSSHVLRPAHKTEDANKHSQSGTVTVTSAATAADGSGQGVEEQEEDDDDEEEEVKEELSFRPLSRSASSDQPSVTHVLPHSPQKAKFFGVKEDERTLEEDEDDDEEEDDDDDAYLTSDEDSAEAAILVASPRSSVPMFGNDVKVEEEEEEKHDKMAYTAAAAASAAVKVEDEVKWEEILIEERIGIGGFAEVFRGKIETLHQHHDEFDDDDGDAEDRVAIKKLINQNPQNVHEFALEIEIMRKIKHPNITKFIGACTKAPHMCIVTELLEMSLFDLLHNTRVSLSIDVELKIALGATQGVGHLHEHDIIHRDLKSANILLDKQFSPRITDFGLSRMKDQSTMTAGTGTLFWMAPEVLQGKKYDEKSDVYSLAIIFWEIKTGMIPFESFRLNGIQASVAVITQKKRPKLDTSVFKNKEQFDRWKSLIVNMWSQAPSKRPNAKNVIQSLQEF